MNIAILGAGGIARTFANTINHTEGAVAYAIAARDIERAKAFCEEFSFEKAYGSYEEMLQDEAVELVYIATPHSHHFEHMKLCIQYGKPVLCEKAFTINETQAREILSLAKEKKVFVAEAIWTRYMPSRKIINDLLASGVIGEVKTMTANLSYVISDKERLIRPELAGGALLDVGIYCLNFAFMHFGKEIDRIESSVFMTETGVDGQETITIFYKNGKMAALTSGIYGRSDRRGVFYGDKGYMVIDNINNPRKISIYDVDDCLLQTMEMPEQFNGYEYELLEAMKSVEAGKLEPESMPHEETIYCLSKMDEIRALWGMKYPME